PAGIGSPISERFAVTTGTGLPSRNAFHFPSLVRATRRKQGDEHSARNERRSVRDEISERFASPGVGVAAAASPSTNAALVSRPLSPRAIRTNSSLPRNRRIVEAESTSGLQSRTRAMATGSSSLTGRFQTSRAQADRCARSSPNAAESTAATRESNSRARFDAAA